MPDIEFVNSQKTEEHRWKKTHEQVADGWFVNHGFLVVPELRRDIPTQIQVVLPSKVDYVPTSVEPFVRQWRRVEKEFWVELNHYLPEAKKIHEHIRVDVGKYGALSSVYWPEAHYYLRSDRSVADFAAMIVNNALYIGRKNLGVTWTKREALMDFVMTRPAMKRLFPDFVPVYTQLLQVPPAVRDECRRYIESLGIVIPGKELVVRHGKVYVKNVGVDQEIGKKEKILLKLLIQSQGELVGYDELADAIWGEGEFKSFWALAKLVERLREKLQNLGMEGERIESIRGQGYLLK